MVNFKLIALVASGLFLLSTPALHPQIWGNEKVDVQVNKSVTVPKTDEEIKKAIKDEINTDKEFAEDTNKVDIKIEHGKVTLTGTVADQDTKEDVEAVAKDIAGDNNVVNNIVVQEDKN